MSDRPLRVLVCRPDHLGDLLLTLAALPPHDPAALHIGVACPPALAPVATRCPAVDSVVQITFSDPASQPTAVALAALDAAAATLAGHWDVALLPRIDDEQSGRLCAAAGIPHRLGYDHPATRRWLTDAYAPPDGHVSELTQLLVQSLQIESPTPTTPMTWITPTRADLRDADAVLQTHALVAERLALLHPGAGWPLKRWPPQHWAQVAAWLMERGWQVALTGIASERPLHDAIVAASTAEHAPRLVSLAGVLPLTAMLGLVARARVLLAIDSGPLHLAAAVGTPLVGLYGPFGPRLFGPVGDSTQQRVLTLQLPCQPCNTLETPPCGATTLPACLTMLAPAQVIAALESLPGIAEADSTNGPHSA